MFGRNSGKDLDKILAETQSIIDKSINQEFVAVGQRYLKIMKLIKADDSGEFVDKEEARITKLLKQSMSNEKRVDLQKNLNILKSFHFKSVRRDEL